MLIISTATGNATSVAGKWSINEKNLQTQQECDAGVIVFTVPPYGSSPPSVIEIEWKSPEKEENVQCVQFM